MKIYFAKNNYHIKNLINNIGIDIQQDIIIPLMPKAALCLNDIYPGKARLPIEYLDKKVREDIYFQAIELSKSWYLPIKEDCKFKNIDLIDCCRLQFLGFFQDVITSDLIASILIDLYKPDKVVFFDQPAVASLAHSMHDGTADVIEGVLQWRFSKAGIAIDILNKIDRSIEIKIIKNFFNDFLKKVVNKILLIKKLFTRDHYSLHDKNPENNIIDPQRIMIAAIPDDKPLLMGTGGGYDLIIIWRYIKAFANEIGGYPLLINYSDKFNVATLRSGLSADEDARFLFIGDIPNEIDSQNDLSFIKKKILSYVYEESICPSILKNPLLSFQLNFLLDAMLPGVIASINRAYYFFSRFKTAVLLDDYCAGETNRGWIEVAKQYNIRSIGVPHGAINLTDFNDFSSEYFLTWGDLGKKSLSEAYPERIDRIYSAGDPSVEAIAVSQPKKQQFKKKNRVLFLTGGFLHQAWTDMDLNNFLCTWEELLNIAKNRPDIEFIIKPHPSVRDLGYWYKELLGKKSIENVTVIDDKKLEDLLSSSFLSVLVGKPGTAGIVSAQNGVPFVYLDSMLCRDVIGYKIWVDKNGSPRITDVKKLAEYIDLSVSNEDFYQSLLNQNNKFSENYLTRFQQEIISRLVV